MELQLRRRRGIFFWFCLDSWFITIGLCMRYLTSCISETPNVLLIFFFFLARHEHHLAYRWNTIVPGKFTTSISRSASTVEAPPLPEKTRTPSTVSAPPTTVLPATVTSTRPAYPVLDTMPEASSTAVRMAPPAPAGLPSYAQLADKPTEKERVSTVDYGSWIDDWVTRVLYDSWLIDWVTGVVR